MDEIILDDLPGGFDSENYRSPGIQDISLTVRVHTRAHVRALGGGGGGGGCNDRKGFGEGGRRGECRQDEETLHPGTYTVHLGIGGAGGRCFDEDPPAEGGKHGGETWVSFAASGLRIAEPAKGGEGGRPNVGESHKHGQDSVDENGTHQFDGGSGGKWQHNGHDAKGSGAGGGGAGNQGGDDPNLHGGRGGNGRVQIVRVA